MTQPSFFECSGTPSNFVVSGTPNWAGTAPVRDGSTAPLQSGGGVEAAVLGVLAVEDVPLVDPSVQAAVAGILQATNEDGGADAGGR